MAGPARLVVTTNPIYHFRIISFLLGAGSAQMRECLHSRRRRFPSSVIHPDYSVFHDVRTIHNRA